MKHVILVTFLSIFSQACGLRVREQELERKRTEVSRKEQELLLREQSLQLKEKELAQREKRLDSSNKNPADSFISQHPQLPGKWNVTMNCTETTCAGSAVGDNKNEQWEFSYQKNSVVVHAFSNNKLVRVYSGSSSAEGLELSAQPAANEAGQPTKMIVRLSNIEESKMQGVREIIRPDNCRIVYALDFSRQ